MPLAVPVPHQAGSRASNVALTSFAIARRRLSRVMKCRRTCRSAARPRWPARTTRPRGVGPAGGMAVIKDRRVLAAIVAVIALVAIYHNPQGSGGAVRDAFDVLAGAIQGMFDFAEAVIR